jgi:NAD(P)-dependent dehydrogenase (short-subunit alcohol dehydrogenase family)
MAKKKNKWTTDNIPDLTGRSVVVTGANTGLGKETAKALAAKNAIVVMAVRSLEKGENAAEEIRKIYPTSQLDVMELDLSDLNSVSMFARDFSNKYNRLDLLINNAGVMMPPYSKTADGFELQFGTNHLGAFCLDGPSAAPS